MNVTKKVKAYTAIICGLALAAFLFSFALSPFPISEDILIVLGTFIAVSLLGALLSLQITEGGSRTTLDFVPQLAAVVLVGPAATGIITTISWTAYQLLFTEKPATKIVFNVGQILLSVCLAGIVFILAGGEPSFRAFSLGAVLPPFAAGVITYFVANRITVSYVIAISEKRPVREVWQVVPVTPLIFEIAASSLGLLLAYLYVQWGPIALFAIMVPIVVLRYSYGVNLELRQLNSDLLRVLIKTIEAQDPYTSGHSVRVAEGALAIAKEMGVSGKKRRHIETAALLHDIGKIDAVYRKILRQEGPLTDEQRRLIKEHPQRGVDLVESVRALDRKVLDYILHHHERYDGTGYPDGLEGEEIPLGARIIMVSDSIDAMITARPYRDALPKEVVVEELKNNKGSQFDPDVVGIALAAGLVEKTQDAISSGDELLRSKQAPT